MRVALVVHAFPPCARTGVEVYSEALARALARRGHAVEVLAGRPDGARPPLEQRREERDGYGLTWLAFDPHEPDEDRRRELPGAAEALGRFLEREQPDVVHFQHLLRFGPAALDVARAQGRPSLFTAHDPFGACEDYNLLRPDLAPFDVGDFEAQARCRLGRELLDRRLATHAGFLSPRTAVEEGEVTRELARVLAGEGEQERRVPALARELRSRRLARLKALARVDHLEAPTRWLTELLRDAGLEREVELRPCGIERDGLVGAPRRPRPAGAPLRVLYLGGYAEPKGVHVLVEACAELDACPGFEGVQLELRGSASGGPYAAELAATAARSGARLGGPYERAELPGLLASADLLAVPSLWPENAPFVIREAFAAGLPVLASDSPALRESVRDGVDGRLLPAGDVAAWRAALAELARDGEALRLLADGVRPPISIDEDARWLEERYAELAEELGEARARSRARLPEHLRSFAERHERWSRTPTRELVDSLAARLAGTPAAEALRAASNPLLRERLAEARRAVRWRETVARDQEHGLAALRASAEEATARAESEAGRAGWLEGLVREREERLAWLEEGRVDRARTLEAARAELELARQTAESRAAELELERRTAKSHEEELELERATRAELEGRLAEGERALAAAREEAKWRDSERAALAAEVAWLRATLDDREAAAQELEGRVAAGEEAFEAVRAESEENRRARAHFEWSAERETRRAAELEDELSALRAALEPLQTELAAQREARGDLETEHGGLLREREAAREHEHYLEARARSLEEELAWRQGEMRRAAEELAGGLRLLFDARLRRRVEAWRSAERGGGEA